MNADFLILMKSELIVTLVIFILLILKVWDGIRENATWLRIANVLLAANFAASLAFNDAGTLFSGMYRTDGGIAFVKAILNLATLIVSLQAYDWLKTHKHAPEFFILLLTTLLGMFFMISAGNFLMFYLGLEIASIPLAALANFDLEKLKSSEAAAKMILLSAFSSCILLFGISLLYGSAGSLQFSELRETLGQGHLQTLSLVFVFVGFAFKLSSVPFHFWTADVYEGAPAPVTAYLSVVSKAAIAFVFLTALAGLFTKFQDLWRNILFLSIALSITVGNLFALRQRNIKRFLAFSSIAQAGYILLGVSGTPQYSRAAVVYFLLAYAFSNLGAFSVIGVVSALAGKEDVDDYKGFYKTNKALAWALAISLFSLAGVPPTAGFFGKMFLITSGASSGNTALIIIASLNMVISLYYYLRIVRAMFVEPNDAPIERLEASWSAKAGLVLCMIGVVAMGFAGGVYDYIGSLF